MKSVTMILISVVCLCTFVNACYPSPKPSPSCPPPPPSCPPPPPSCPPSASPSPSGSLADITVEIQVLLNIALGAAQSAMKSCGDIAKGGTGSLATIQAQITAVVNAVVGIGNLLNGLVNI